MPSWERALSIGHPSVEADEFYTSIKTGECQLTIPWFRNT